MNMLYSSLCILTVITAHVYDVHGGELSIIHSPSYVHFVPTNDLLPTSHVTKMILATFGRQTEGDMTWRGLLDGNFFQRPKAMAMISVNGVVPGTFNLAQHFQYNTTEDEGHIDADSVVSGLETFVKDDQPLLYVDLAVDKNYQLQALTNDYQLHVQLPLYSTGGNRQSNLLAQEMRAIRHTVRMLQENFVSLQRSTPDFFHYRIDGLARLRERYGDESVEFKEGLALLEKLIAEVTDVYRHLYNDNVIVQVLSYTPSRSGASMSDGRKGRKLLQQQTTQSSNTVNEQYDLNLAPEFSWMYPDIFNIALWFMVVFILIVYGVGWCMWFTDPGRDGLIYRMTTHHIKDA